MPQNTPSKTKKKKKGPSPAHQNSFAFQHNPKSKKTQTILESPIVYVCRRCHDKLEWRKQYRKYKPLRQPAKCNGCQKRNITRAYHTLCESCTRTSSKAQELVNEWNAKAQEVQQNEQEQGDTGMEPSNGPYRRVCAVCVKEPAIYDDTDEDDIEAKLSQKLRQAEAAKGRPLKLREVKAMERQLVKQTQSQSQEQQENDDDDDGHSKEDPQPQQSDDNDQALRKDTNDTFNIPDQDDDDDDDPFLKAVGGADQLLTGEAYQLQQLKLRGEL